MVPRVLTVQCGPGLEDTEAVVAADGDAALGLLRRERFDAVIVDLGLAPIDSWCVLATIGDWVERPRLVAIVTDAAHVGRALVLGADLCVMAGTQLNARALCPATSELPKETQCPRPLETNFPRPTTSGVPA